MTIATGFCCSDGILLAADTLISMIGSSGKSYESKILEVDFDLNMYLTYAGDPDFAKEYVNELSEQVKGKNPMGALAGAKSLATRLYAEHFFAPETDFKTHAAMLLTLQDSHDVSVYSINEKHFVRVQSGFVALGIGQDQVQAFFEPYFKPKMDMRRCERVARYGIFKAKKFVQGCGGKTEVREVSNVPRSRSIKKFSVLESDDIDSDFEFFDRQVGKLLVAYSGLGVDTKKFRKVGLDFIKSLEEQRKRTMDSLPAAWQVYFKDHS
jgi:20S proteasome alpha/beta subunit